MNCMTAIIASGAIAGFSGGVVGALLDGASPGQAFIAGLTGGVLGGLTAGISTMIGNMSSTIARAISHGVVSGIRAVIQGGNFIRGFMSSFASTYLQPLGRMFAKGSYYGRAVFSALVGGTVSAIGGGKFANGAVTSAFQFVFNEWGHRFWADFKKGAIDLKGGIMSYPKALMAYGDYLARSTGFRDWQDGNIIKIHKWEANMQYKVFEFAMKNDKLREKIIQALVTDIKTRPLYYTGSVMTPGFLHSAVGVKFIQNILLSSQYFPVKVEGSIINEINSIETRYKK